MAQESGLKPNGKRQKRDAVSLRLWRMWRWLKEKQAPIGGSDRLTFEQQKCYARKNGVVLAWIELPGQSHG